MPNPNRVAAQATSWTPLHTQQLRELWDLGIPTAEIGRRLGVTKNAVIGKSYRLGLVARAIRVRHLPAAQQYAMKE